MAFPRWTRLTSCKDVYRRHINPIRQSSTYNASSRPNTTSSADISDLRVLFDVPTTTSLSSNILDPVGLFGRTSMKSPKDLSILANDTIARAKAIVRRISTSSQSPNLGAATMIRNFDRLSDLLCGVIDLSELVRNVHPDPHWLQAADDAYRHVCSYMNVLNTDVGLYNALAQVMNDPSTVSTLGPEEHAVALIFLRDFERSGIHLSPNQRNDFVALSDEIIDLGQNFVRNAHKPLGSVDISLEALERTILPEGRSLISVLSSQKGRRSGLFGRKSGTARIRGHSWEAQMILRYCSDGDIRRRVYMCNHHPNTPDNVAPLESLLRARASLAQLLGKSSYGHMALVDKMAKTPDNVLHFLNVLAHHHRPSALSAMDQLARTGTNPIMASSPPVPHPVLNAWDRDFLSARLVIPSSPSPSFTIGAVFTALSRLFSRLYGLSLRVTDASSGEIWHPSVRKLEMWDENSSQVIGWIYADLFHRQGKTHGAAHYTVRCSRRVDKDVWRDDEAYMMVDEKQDMVFGMSGTELGDGGAPSVWRADMAPRRLWGKEGTQQLPIAVLSCDFTPPSIETGATLIPWHEIETLFHEMGHAIHSMIGQTEYHNVAGTRCATDLVELPSILMEQLLASPQVQSLFFTDGVSNPTTNHLQSTRSPGQTQALDIHNQIIMATLDQLYHSPVVFSEKFAPIETYESLQESLGVFPPVRGTAWPIQFTHLYGYGSTYYSYLFDQAIAARVFQKVFKKDPLSREAGEKYKEELLKFGGGKDPWLMVGRLLGEEEILEGGKSAMEEVGKWGIAHSVGNHIQ